MVPRQWKQYIHPTRGVQYFLFFRVFIIAPKVNKTVQLMSPVVTEKNQVQNRLSYVSYKVMGLGATRTLKLI